VTLIRGGQKRILQYTASAGIVQDEGDLISMKPARYQPVCYPYGPDPAQYGELWLPGDPAAGTVVIVHGGFWRARYDLSLGRPLAADLAGRGYAVWNLEYRRVGGGGGWPATFEDIAAGIDLLADLPVSTGRVAAIGHSAGGHLAAWAAGRARLEPGAPGAEPRVALTAVVAQAGVLALADSARQGVGGTAALDLMGGGPQDLPERYRLADPMAALPLTASVLCVHARADENVPFRYSDRYVQATVRAGGTAYLQETTGDHFTLIDPGSPDWQAVVGALPGLLGRGDGAELGDGAEP
jgi:acetyl esterase/lipase